MRHRNRRPKEKNKREQEKAKLHKQAKALEKELIKGNPEKGNRVQYAISECKRGVKAVNLSIIDDTPA